MRRNLLTIRCALPVLLLLLSVSSGFAAGSHPVIVVEAVYPGADARIVADGVAAPIEKQVNGVEHLQTMVSHCTNDGRYTLQLSFASGVDLDVAQVLVQNRVNLAETVLPELVKKEGVIIRKLAPSTPLIVVLTSPDAKYDTLYLSNYAAIQIKDKLARLPGVGQVSLLGASDSAVRIFLDQDKLASRSLTATDVVSALREQNVQVAAGQVGQPPVPTEFRLTTLGRLTSAEAIGDIIVKSDSDGRTIRLRDVARVELGSGPADGAARYDGKPAVALAIALLPTAKARDVNIAVRERMQKLRKSFPDGVDYSVALDLTQKDIVGRPVGGWCLLAEPILPATASAERVLEVQKRYADILLKTEGAQHVLVLSKNPFALFSGAPCVAAVFNGDIKGPDWEKLQRTIRTRLLREVKEADLRLRELSGPSGVRLDGYPLTFAVRGPEAKEVRDFGQTLTERLSRSSKLTDVAGRPKMTPQLFVDIDRTKCKALDIAITDVFNTLQVYLGSLYINDFNEFGRTWTIVIDKQPKTDAADIGKLQVRNSKGDMVRLATILTVREVDGPTNIDRVDLYPAAILSANPAPGVSLGEGRWMCEVLAEQVRKELRLPVKYELVWLQELPAAKPIPGEPKAEAEAPPPEVRVAQPTTREVTDYETFTGRIDATQKVDIRARVTGFLDKVSFKEGSEIKKGDVLFVIDARPYQTALDEALAKLKVAEAQRDQSKRALERARGAGAAVAKSEIEMAEDAYQTADAKVKATKAFVEIAKLNVEFTTVRAPIDGRIGRTLVDVGNLVSGDQTNLATLVSVDPASVEFDMDERTFLRLERFARAGKAKSLNEAELPIDVGLADEKDYPHRGIIKFVDNHIDPNTGTIRVRATLSNADHSLRPGQFVRVRLPIGEPHKALLVPEEAIHSDQGRKFVYVVEEGNKVADRTVTLGQMHDGQRAIEKGLREEDRVIVQGRVRPGQVVKPVTAKP